MPAILQLSSQNTGGSACRTIRMYRHKSNPRAGVKPNKPAGIALGRGLKIAARNARVLWDNSDFMPVPDFGKTMH